MDIPKGFLDMVECDIERIDNCLNNETENSLDLFKELDGKYQGCSADWGLSMCEYYPEYKYINVYDLTDYETKENLKLAKAKLTTFKYGMNAISLPEASKTEININNQISVNITFDDVRSQVENMTSITEEETQELLERIDELEDIINSKDKKKTKWQKVSPILKWLADKSFDVAMVVIPLILKLQEQ